MGHRGPEDGLGGSPEGDEAGETLKALAAELREMMKAGGTVVSVPTKGKITLISLPTPWGEGRKFRNTEERK